MRVQLSEGISLLSKAIFDYKDPHSAEVTITDLAGSLAKVCRFSGHIPYFYSVAQHSVNASYIVPPELAFDALMHDTSEAFTNDIPTPLKAEIPAFKELENRIEGAMSERFGFTYPLGPIVKHADMQMLWWEKLYIKMDTDEWAYFDGYDMSDTVHREVDLSSWQPAKAQTMFLTRYIQLGGHV